jgi:hypothetical protein
MDLPGQPGALGERGTQERDAHREHQGRGQRGRAGADEVPGPVGTEPDGDGQHPHTDGHDGVLLPRVPVTYEHSDRGAADEPEQETDGDDDSDHRDVHAVEAAVDVGEPAGAPDREDGG